MLFPSGFSVLHGPLGLDNAKYIYILAFDGYKRPHFHILLSGDGMDRDELEELWGKCDRPNTRRIKPDDDFLITGLATYISQNCRYWHILFILKGRVYLAFQ